MMRRSGWVAGAGLLLLAGLALPTTNADFSSTQQVPNSFQTNDSFDRVNLRSAANFSVLGYAHVTNGGPTVLSQDIGVSPGDSIDGFPPGVIRGETHLNDQTAITAQQDFLTAYNYVFNLPGGVGFAGDQIGATFTPGFYTTDAAFALTGTMTLDGLNEPNGYFIFRIKAALNTAAASRIVLINGARASNVFFLSVGAAGTGANSTFVGSVLANGAVTAGAGSHITGRVLSRGLITLATNTICDPLIIGPCPASN